MNTTIPSSSPLPKEEIRMLFDPEIPSSEKSLVSSDGSESSLSKSGGAAFEKKHQTSAATDKTTTLSPPKASSWFEDMTRFIAPYGWSFWLKLQLGSFVQFAFLPFTVGYAAVRWVPSDFKKHFEYYGARDGILAGLGYFILAFPTAVFAFAAPFILAYNGKISGIQDVIANLFVQYRLKEEKKVDFSANDTHLFIYALAILLSSLLANLKFSESYSKKVKENFLKDKQKTVALFFFPGAIAAIPLLAISTQAFSELPSISGVPIADIFGWLCGLCNVVIYGMSRGMRCEELLFDILNGNWQRKNEITWFMYLLTRLSPAERKYAEWQLECLMHEFGSSFDESLKNPEAVRSMLDTFAKLKIVEKYTRFKYKLFFYYSPILYAIFTSIFVIPIFSLTAYNGVNQWFPAVTSESSLPGKIAIGALFAVWTGVFYFFNLWFYFLDSTRFNYRLESQPHETDDNYHRLDDLSNPAPSVLQMLRTRAQVYKNISLASGFTVFVMAWNFYWIALNPSSIASQIFSLTCPILFTALAADIINYISVLDETLPKKIPICETDDKIEKLTRTLLNDPTSMALPLFYRKNNTQPVQPTPEPEEGKRHYDKVELSSR